MATSVTEDARAPSSPFLLTAAAAVPRREIIYTGEMTVEVDDVEKATSQVEKATLAVGGWVAARQLDADSEGRRTATISIRVPAGKFAATHEALRKIGGIVHDVIRSNDVGKEFVDLEARLSNLEREETVIAGLFARQGKIGDVLQVERELGRVRGEIEQLRGQLRYLTDQVAYSSLSIGLTPKRPVIEQRMESWNLGYHVLRAWRALGTVARTLVYLVIYTVILTGPFALLGWTGWRIAGEVRRRRAAPPGGPP